MPSTATITTFYDFTPSTRIRSAHVNNNFANFRGHLLPTDASAASSPTQTYDLGATAHLWRGIYNQYGVMFGNTSGALPPTPPTNHFGLYFKNNGLLYSKDPAGTETLFNNQGVYTPTATAVLNVDTITVYTGMYIQMNNIVVAVFRADINQTAGGDTESRIRITLPVTSDFTQTYDAAGVIYSYDENRSGSISADTVNNQALLVWRSNTTGATALNAVFIFVVK
jgi:hypothetical protein